MSIGAINRTILELKFVYISFHTVTGDPINRTIFELK